MKALKFSLLSISSFGLLFLISCGSSSQTASKPPVSATTDTTTPSPDNTSDGSKSSTGHPQTSQGGQVIESGPYHLEFVPEKEANGIHLDFYLQKGDTHSPIPDAKVMAQVQRPDGTQKLIDLKYDPDGKHYTGLFPDSAAGEYKVVILSDINGEKVNGRFSFKQ